MKFEKLVCGDCKAVLESPVGKRGSAFIEKFLWLTLFFPGILYHFWRKTKPKKICDYCGSNFLMPADSPYAAKLLPTIKPIIKK